MATVRVIKHNFTNETTGETVPYERLGIIGVIGGEVHTLELKLEKAEMQLAKVLLASNEEVGEVVYGTKGGDVTVNRSSEDKIDLNSDNEDTGLFD